MLQGEFGWIDRARREWEPGVGVCDPRDHGGLLGRLLEKTCVLLEIGSKSMSMGVGGAISWVLLRLERAGQEGGGPAAGGEMSFLCSSWLMMSVSSVDT